MNFCSGKSSSSFGCAITTAALTKGRTHEIPCANKPGKAPFPSASCPAHTIATCSLPTHATRVTGTDPPLFWGTGGFQRGGRHHVREFKRMTEDLTHRSGGACAGDRPAGRSLQMERKGLKEVGRRGIISGNKSLGLSVVFCATSLLLTSL